MRRPPRILALPCSPTAERPRKHGPHLAPGARYPPRRNRAAEKSGTVYEPETKAGLVSYDGPTHGSHEWEFMTPAKVDCTKGEEKVQLAGKVFAS